MAFEEISAGLAEADVEAPEVVEPADESHEAGVEDQEVTAPESEEPEESGKAAADAAFARMRRQVEEAEQARADAVAELESLRAKQAARETALINMDIDDIDAIAEVTGMTREEVLDNIEREEAAAAAEIESLEKDRLIEGLQERINEVEAEKVMAQDLAELKKFDPSIKSLDDLGPDFPAYISAGLTAKQAYFAIRGEDIATRSTPATAPGRITEAAPPEKDYFTETEVANMTSEEKSANAEKIMASLPRWYKKR